MRSLLSASKPASRQGGFTMVEVLVVMAVIIILSALLIPAIGPLMSSYNLNRAAGQVTDELNFCRQTALTKNADIEVRFYKIGTSSNPTDLQFRAFRAFYASTSTPAAAVPLDKITYLPEPIILSSKADPGSTNPSTTFSPLLDSGTYDVAPYPVAPSTPILSTGTDTLPNGTSAAYVSFLFRATGGTNLPLTTTSTPPIGLWYLTIYSQNAPIIAATSLPSNYVTVQVDSVDGQLRTYRP